MSNHMDFLKKDFTYGFNGLYPNTLLTTSGAIEQVEKIGLAKPKDEWILVKGYKGTDKNMCCRGFQYEIGKQFDMPEGFTIEECQSGFHLCKELKDVFRYYKIGDDNRFFEVRALVKKSDYAAYDIGGLVYVGFALNNKLVAKTIEFVRELTADEVFEAAKDRFDLDSEWTAADNEEAMHVGINAVNKRYQDARNLKKVDELVELGYSRPFATYIVKDGEYESAKAVASQPDLSMDMKCLIIFRHDLND